MVIINYSNYSKLFFQTNKEPNYTGITFTTLNKVFRKNNLLHRYYGPAILSLNGNKEWCFNGNNYGNSCKEDNFCSQKQFLKDISKLWLL